MNRLLAAALVAWLVVTVLALASGPPMGHDEAAFGVLARGGGAATWLYRSSGVVVLAKLGVLLGGAEWAMRIASALVGFGVPLAVYAVGRAAFSARTGAWAAAVIAGAHPMVLRSTEMIGDLPATACLLAGIAVLVEQLDKGITWRLLLAAPAFAAAFYLRYGSAPVIALAGAAALILWWRAILARPLPVIATAGLFALLLAPHVIQSLHTTGSMLGILEYSSHMPRREYVGEGLVTYVTSNPFLFYGALIAPVMIAGLAGLARVRKRATYFLGAIALGQIIAIGLQSHAQPRYIFVAIALLVVLGVEFLRDRAYPRPRAAFALVAASWLACAVAIIPYNRHLGDLRGPLLAAARTIRADAAGEPCTVYARVVTQLAWYTGCDTELVRDPTILEPMAANRRVYVANVPHGNVSIEPVAATLHATPRPIATQNALSAVWRVQ